MNKFCQNKRKTMEMMAFNPEMTAKEIATTLASPYNHEGRDLHMVYELI